MPEFQRHALEVLRQPLEEGRVRVARAARTVVFPARFMLIGAMNPCPCGFPGDSGGRADARPRTSPVRLAPVRAVARSDGPVDSLGAPPAGASSVAPLAANRRTPSGPGDRRAVAPAARDRRLNAQLKGRALRARTARKRAPPDV